jgi:predicted nucleic acid-binding protein
MRGFVLDSGALIALERHVPMMRGLLDRALDGTVEIVIPRTVIAQTWRGTPRQANVNRLINAVSDPLAQVIIDELTADRAKQIGLAIGETAHPDIVDAHVALAAAECGYAVLTSDDANIAKLSSDIVIVHV